MTDNGVYFFARTTRNERYIGAGIAFGLFPLIVGSFFLAIYLDLSTFLATVLMGGCAFVWWCVTILFTFGWDKPKAHTLEAWQASGLESAFADWAEVSQIKVLRLKRQTGIIGIQFGTGELARRPFYSFYFDRSKIMEIHSFLATKIGDRFVRIM